MPPSATPRDSSAHPSPLCPALHLPFPPVILTRGCMTPKAGLSAASLRSVFVFCFWMFLGLFLFGAEHCSPSDVLIGLPWGPCPSPPAGENHPPPPWGRITAVEGQPASLGCTLRLPAPQRSQHCSPDTGPALSSWNHLVPFHVSSLTPDVPQTPVCIRALLLLSHTPANTPLPIPHPL